MDILEQLTRFINYGYLLAVILLVWIILTYIILKPSRWTNIAIHIGCGVILGFVWYYIVKGITLEQLIVDFLLSIMVYNWAIKALLDKFNITYDNGKGLTDNNK